MPWCAGSSLLLASVAEQPGQERLLRVQAVLRLIPGGAGVQYLIGDLLATVRGQAVQDNHVRLGAREQVTVDLVRAEGRHPVEPLGLPAPRRPGVRVDHV